MKKLITLAVAVAIAAPMAVAAETTLYGRLHNSLVHVDPDAAGADDYWDVETYTTRIGVKGSEDLGGGLKAIFQAEWAFSSSEGGSTADGLKNRLAYVGLAGGFGTFAIGRQWTPYYGAVDKTDIFNTPGFNGYTQSTFRTGNALAYVSPNFNGFQAKVAAVVDKTGDDNVDAINLSLNYNNGPISVGVGYHDQDNDATAATYKLDTSSAVPAVVVDSAAAAASETSGWGLAASYNFGMFKVIGQYEDWEQADVDVDNWAVAAEAYFGNNTVRALYANEDMDGADEQDTWVIGVQHNFSKATRVYAEYGDIEDSQSKFSIGLRHDF